LRFHSLFNVRVIIRLKYETSSYYVPFKRRETYCFSLIFFFRFRFFWFFSAKLVRTITFLSFQIGQLYLVCGCMTIRRVSCTIMTFVGPWPLIIRLKYETSSYYVSPSNEGRHIVLVWFFLPLPLLLLPLLLSEACPDHNFFVFPDRSIIFGIWVHDHKAVCRVP
jgi:hypothetical protein